MGRAPAAGNFPQDVGPRVRSEHLLLTAPRLEGNLRCPSIIVRSELAGKVKYVGGGIRWLAAELATGHGRPVLLVAAHFPHVRIPTEIFTEVLQDLDGILAMHGDHDIIIGMDANTKLDGLVDHFHIGPHFPELA